MIYHTFYVMSDDGKQISDTALGQINDFTSFARASSAARKYSKNNHGCYTVGVAVPSTIYENGKAREF